MVITHLKCSTDARFLFTSVCPPLLHPMNSCAFHFFWLQNGMGGTSRQPVLSPWMYDPYAPVGNRTTVMASSTIPRFYHSISLLLPDGSVLIAGSEKGEQNQAVCGGGGGQPGPTMQKQQAKGLPKTGLQTTTSNFCYGIDAFQ